MKVDKGDVLTFRLRVDDVGLAGPFLGALLGSMTGAPHRGCTVTATARGDVFTERDTVAALLEEAADRLAFSSDDEDIALVDRIEEAHP